MKDPSMQSEIATPQTPQAMLIPDHGTTPMRRRTDNRTHADDWCLVVSRSVSSESDVPSRALRVMSNAFGKKCDRYGPIGLAKRVAQADPMVVSAVNKTVANAGEKRAPASTF